MYVFKHCLNHSILKWRSFIEENHKYKLVSRMSQHSQPSQNGAPSQDLMSYWGILVLPCMCDQNAHASALN